MYENKFLFFTVRTIEHNDYEPKQGGKGVMGKVRSLRSRPLPWKKKQTKEKQKNLFLLSQQIRAKRKKKATTRNRNNRSKAQSDWKITKSLEKKMECLLSNKTKRMKKISWKTNAETTEGTWPKTKRKSFSFFIFLFFFFFTTDTLQFQTFLVTRKAAGTAESTW